MVLETLMHLAWQYACTGLLCLLGVPLAVWGIQTGQRGLRGAMRGDPAQLIPCMQGFRAAVIGLALIGVGLAWALHLPWLMILSLTTAAGETLESTLILFAIRHGAHLQIGRPHRRTAGISLQQPFQV